MAKNNDLGVDFSFFSSDEASSVDIHTSLSEEESKKPEKRKRGRPAGTQVKPHDPGQSMIMAEEPYADSFRETQNALKGTVIQTDDLINRINEDIDAVRKSKTLKNKYTYITNLTSSASSLIGAKIQGLREINSSIKTSHELELKRMQAMHQDKTEQNDDMKMMDLYNAFVNLPIGAYNPETTMTNSNPADMAALHGTTISGNTPVSGGPISPEQNRMRLESNPNIKEVVKFNQTTGERYFDVIDVTTGASVENYPRSDSFLLTDTTIDVRAGIARNRNIDMVWPLVVYGTDSDY